MKLSDLIIGHGPYQAGDTSPFYGGVDLHELNALREELTAARQASEDRQRFRIYAVPFARGAGQLGITCDRNGCGWHTGIDDFTSLAELNQRAGEHAQVCR